MDEILAPAVNRRSFLGGAAALTLGAVHPAFAQSPNFSTTTFGGFWGECYRSMVIEPFQKKFGAEVKLKLGTPSEWLTGGLVTRKRPSVDLLMLPYPQSIQAVLQDLGQPIDASKIPNMKNVHSVWIDQYNGTGVGLDYVAYGVSVRTDLLPMPIKSWGDLWNPAFKGKLGVPDIASAGSWELLVMAAKLNGGDEKNLEPGFEAMKRLRPNIRKFIMNAAEQAQLLEAGEIFAAAMTTNTTPYAMQDAGKAVDFLVPAEGSMVGMVSYHVAQNAANPKLAFEFINFALEKEQQVNFCSKLAAGPVIKDAELLGKSKDRVPPLERLTFFDWKVLAPKMADLAERWSREIAV